MKTMKFLLTSLLIFGTMPLTTDLSVAEAAQSKVKSGASQRSVSSMPSELEVEVELIRMIDPFGNEVKYSLSEKVMGRALNTDDFSIAGVTQPEHSVLCQKTLSPQQELRKVELKLEAEMLVEELAKQTKPRRLNDAQMDLLAKIPQCDQFRLPLTAISKLLGGYDYDSLAVVTD
jgi:hypothetical protein